MQAPPNLSNRLNHIKFGGLSLQGLPGDESIRPQFSPQKNVVPEPCAALAFLSRKWCYPKVYVIDQQACQNWSEKMGGMGKGIIFVCRKKTQVLRSSVSSNFNSFRGLLQNRNRLFVWQDNFWDTKLAATFANRAHPECKKRDGGCPCEGRAFWLWWHWLGGGFKYFFNVHPYLRKWSNYIWLIRFKWVETTTYSWVLCHFTQIAHDLSYLRREILPFGNRV